MSSLDVPLYFGRALSDPMDRKGVALLLSYDTVVSLVVDG